MKNQVLDNFQRALTALVGLLTTDKSTPIDTTVFCAKYKMSDEQFFPALRGLNCVMIAEPVNAQPLYLTRTQRLLTIDPEAVIAAVRRLSKTKGEPIVWHTPEDEGKDTSPATGLNSTPVLAKAITDTEPTDRAFDQRPDIDLPLEEEGMLTMDSRLEETGGLTMADKTLTLDDVVVPADRVKVIETSQIELTPNEVEAAAGYAHQISNMLTDQPMKQRWFLQAVFDQISRQQSERAQELRDSAANFIKQAEEFSALAGAYEQCL